ncbi:MAG: AAA family ATPase [Deltaproteobacteria bacterium]|nr:AAA family ATPase [Deltaproteobacteria bacterium]MBW2138421.1 AAA family ATPase [Deltaproteobacteria bacterium]
MNYQEETQEFYMSQLPEAVVEGNVLKAPCPFCQPKGTGKRGMLIVHLDPESLFFGYFRCLMRCQPGGFPIYFGKITNMDPAEVPGVDLDREPYIRDIQYPPKNINGEIKKFLALMGEEEYAYFNQFGVSRTVLDEMRIGYNGRYLVYPYYQEDGNCYAARCVVPGKEEDAFWYGDEAFSADQFQIFNIQEVERCEGGALFITEGEDNLLALKELGFPGIGVPSCSVLEAIEPEILANLKNILLAMDNTPEAQISSRSFATRLGYRARILKWPTGSPRGYNFVHLAKEKGKDFRAAVSSLLRTSESYSPFPSPLKEHGDFIRYLEREKGKSLLGLESGMERLDHALNGVRGINVMGGQPKAGKSCFFMQITTEMAMRKVPVIYYDFENGRQKIYNRTLCRLSRLSEHEIRKGELEQGAGDRLREAEQKLKELLHHFRIVTDRKLNPEIMRRQIDFLQYETGKDHVLVVIDSLHKLPFKDLSERRTGIDEWLRHLEAIRDEQGAAFFVVSELSRDSRGKYSQTPDLASFKESGDIEYSADNAMILIPNWDPVDPISKGERKSSLWLVASRENNPGKIAEYALEYPYWGFREL